MEEEVKEEVEEEEERVLSEGMDCLREVLEK